MELEDELWLLEAKLRLLDSVSEHLKERLKRIKQLYMKIDDTK